LQGLTTNDTRKLESPNSSQFTAFLNGKGRTLFEAVVSVSQTKQLIAAGAATPILVDMASHQKDELFAHLKMFKLRSKFELLDLSASHSVWSVVSRDPFALAFDSPEALESRVHLLVNMRRASDTMGSPFASAFVDPRASRLGLRMIAPSNMQFDGLSSPSGGERDYDALRVLLGVPQGREVSDAIPMEWNLNLLNGVAFDKGCYVGQELVARTHFRGLIRKRFVPVYLTAGGAPAKVVGCADPVAAAMLRRPDNVMHSGLVHAGGYGHGQGHGPAQKHDFPPSIAHGHEQPHSKIHLGGASAAVVGSAPSQQHGIRIPFPYVDLAWRGEAPIGESVVSASPDDKGERVGKLMSAPPGINLGFALLRLEHLRHTLPALGSNSLAELEDFNADYTNDTTVKQASELHQRCATRAVDFKISRGDTTYRVTPVLPAFWRLLDPPPEEPSAASA
jgi:folate-binding protein YgfZ